MNMYSYGTGFNDPNTQRIFLEQRKQQLEREYDQAQKTMQGIQQQHGMVCAQIKALESFQAQPAPVQAQPDVGLMLGVPGLTAEGLQAVLGTPDGQALMQLVRTEFASLLQKAGQSGGPPGGPAQH